jgi:AcrR family transcriptional regulator
MDTAPRILDAALRVFLDEGAQRATTRRIAAEAGVNEVTLFRHFGSKEALLLAALRHDAATSVPPLPIPAADPRRELGAWCAATLHRLRRVRGLIRVAMAPVDGSPALCAQAHEGPARIRAELGAWFRHLRETGRAHRDVDPDLAARLLMGGLFGEVMRPDASDAPESAADGLGAAYADLLLRALAC